MMVVGGEAKSPGLRITWTGTVTGWNLGLAKVTEKPASGAGTSIAATRRSKIVKEGECQRMAFQIYPTNQMVKSEMRPC
jgi:hypothetical protein